MAKNLLIGLGGMGGRIINCVSHYVKKSNIDNDNMYIALDRCAHELRQLNQDNKSIMIFNPCKDIRIGVYIREYETDGVNEWMPINPMLKAMNMLDGSSQARIRARLAFYAASKSTMILELEDKLKGLLDETDEEINVYIVSSLAGDFGAGTLIPLALWVRQYFERHNVPVQIKGMLITPDVFIRTIAQIGRDERECKILRANAYATIRELNAITKIKTNVFKPSFPVKIDEVGFDSSEKQDGKCVFDRAYLIGDVTSSGLALNSIYAYEKAVAQIVYAQMFALIKNDWYYEDDGWFRFKEPNDEPLYGSCGIAKAMYPVDSVYDYCSLKAAYDFLNTGWRTIDKYVDLRLEIEKQREYDGMVITNPRKEYVRLFEEFSNRSEGANKLFYTIRNDVNNELLLNENDRCEIRFSDKIDDFFGSFEQRIESFMENEAPNELFEIKIKADEEEWVNDKYNLYCIEDAKCFVTDKRNTVKKFIQAMDTSIDRMATDLANSICPVDMGNTGEDNDGTVLGLLTKKDENGQRYFIHPIAVRYLLYRLIDMLEEQKKIGGMLESLRNSVSFDEATQRYRSEIYMFDKAKTYEEEDALTYLDKKPLLMSEGRFIKKYKELYYEFNADQYKSCCCYAEKYLTYKTSVILCERLEMLIKIVESFFNSIDKICDKIDDRISENIRETENGEGTVYYVCSSAQDKEYLYNTLELRLDDSHKELNKAVAKAFYEQLCVRENPDAENNKQYIGKNILGIFTSELINIYEKSIYNNYSEKIDLDLYSAVCKSSDMEFARENPGDCENEDTKHERHVDAMRAWAAKLKKNSAPFLNYFEDDERDTDIFIRFWGFNSALAESCSELGEILGVLTEKQASNAYDKHELVCYQANYGVMAENIDVFGEQREHQNNNYYKSYKEIIDKINKNVSEGNEEALVRTPHIDKTWHQILPYISKATQEKMDMEFYRAFWLALAYGKILIDKNGNYQIKVNRINAIGTTYLEIENLEYMGNPIAHYEVDKLLKALKVNYHFISCMEECTQKFEDECKAKSILNQVELLNGKADSKGEAVAGGIASDSDYNALTILVKYVNSSGYDVKDALMLVKSLEKICKEFIGSTFKDASPTDKEECVNDIFFKIYNACSMSNKDIKEIEHWKKLW
ncbi:MAG: hypothetical protein J6D23_02345 [Clostridia bacterium]|nr:hypothetical protein [Clostridia bacterium]